MPYLDIKTHVCLVGMGQAGLSFRNISDFNPIPLTTVYDTIIKYQQLGTTQTHKKITNLMTKVVSTQTIQYKIHKLGKHSCIAPKKPYLLPQDFQRRLVFAQAHRHWTINDWAKVIWTDKSAFKLGKQVDRVQVWRTASKKWNLENLAVNH
ncbi:hypothetical protein O181_106739 [Austropuccinia psidii MF-1]|uniref:Transposase Tc1-like domain-containing protein n=1 Tax=Austropuccinia psidii MF-1 TaxID=1389203 RepID=A0A9Q3JSQ4_9BASI|nr:hypothetical protein [Austropuccinia psidii MF-1]